MQIKFSIDLLFEHINQIVFLIIGIGFLISYFYNNNKSKSMDFVSRIENENQNSHGSFFQSMQIDKFNYEFRQFLNSGKILNLIFNTEKSRLKYLTELSLGLFGGFMIAAIITAFDFDTETKYITGLVAIIVCVGTVRVRQSLTSGYKNTFKNGLLKEIVSYINEGLKYNEKGDLNLFTNAYLESGLYKDFDSLKCEDQISGQIDEKTTIKSAELEATRKNSSSSGGKNSTTIAHVVMTILENKEKTFSGKTIIIDKKSRGREKDLRYVLLIVIIIFVLGDPVILFTNPKMKLIIVIIIQLIFLAFFGIGILIYLVFGKFKNKKLQKIESNNIEFNKRYDIFTSNESQAGTILNADLQNLLLGLKGKYRFSFLKNKIILAKDIGSTYLEPNSLKSLYKNLQMFEKMAKDIRSIINLSEELNKL